MPAADSGKQNGLASLHCDSCSEHSRASGNNGINAEIYEGIFRNFRLFCAFHMEKQEKTPLWTQINNAQFFENFRHSFFYCVILKFMLSCYIILFDKISEDILFSVAKIGKIVKILL